MLLPQSHAFKTLHARLHAVPTQALLQLEALPPRSFPRSSSAVGARDMQPLLELFRSRQVAPLLPPWAPTLSWHAGRAGSC